MTKDILFTSRSFNHYPEFIRSLAEIKKASALTNLELGFITQEQAELISSACDALISDPTDPIFAEQAWCVDGAKINLLSTQCIANCCGLPLEVVNKNQIADDVLSTAQNLTILKMLAKHAPGVRVLSDTLRDKAIEFKDILHLGRSHMQESLPVSWGGVFGAMHLRVQRGYKEFLAAGEDFLEINLGLTPIDSFEFCPPGFAETAVNHLRKISGLELKNPSEEAVSLPNAAYVEALEGNDRFVRLMNALRLLALNVARIGNDFYLYSSGPRCGIAELSLPAIAPGSTIMPGKINPSMPEMMLQILHQTMSVDQMATFSLIEEDIDISPANSSVFFSVLEIIEILGRGCEKFVEKCVAGVGVKEAECAEHLKNSMSLIALVRELFGIEKAIEVDSLVRTKGCTVAQAAVELGLLKAGEALEMLGVNKFINTEELKVFLSQNAVRGGERK